MLRMAKHTKFTHTCKHHKWPWQGVLVFILFACALWLPLVGGCLWIGECLCLVGRSLPAGLICAHSQWTQCQCVLLLLLSCSETYMCNLGWKLLGSLVLENLFVFDIHSQCHPFLVITCILSLNFEVTTVANGPRGFEIQNECLHPERDDVTALDGFFVKLFFWVSWGHCLHLHLLNLRLAESLIVIVASCFSSGQGP